jgi:hypothetical protein
MNPRFPTLALLGCVLLVLAIHLPIFTAYGIHGDELYFVECGKHLAAGYVDHPPLVPFLARVACQLGGCSVAALRIAPLLSRVLSVVLTIVLVRRLGGGAFAQWCAGAAVVLAPAFMRMGNMLCIPVFEPVFWTAGSLLLFEIARSASPRLWLLVGALVGLGFLNKHTMLLWALGAAVSALTVRELRATLRTPFPWLGAIVALAIAAPNVVWQVQNDYATIEFLRNVRAWTVAEVPRSLFLASQLLYMHPFAALLWMPALWMTLRGREPQARIFGIIFSVALATFLVAHGKPYYIAPAYPPLFAVGALCWERFLVRARARGAFIGAQLGTGAALAWTALPFLPLPSLDAAIVAVSRGAVPPLDLTYELHDEHGWREQAEAVGRVWRSLPPEDRVRAEIVTSNYGEAGALNRFGPAEQLPRASSGHMTHFLWGPTNPGARVIVGVGLRRAWLSRRCSSVQQVAVLDHPLAVPGERGVPVVVCRLSQPLGALWHELKQFGDGGAED